MKITKSILLVLAMLFVFNFASACVEDECVTEFHAPISGVDSTENGIPSSFISIDLELMEESDDEKYQIAGSWPNADYDESYYLLWDDFNVSLPDCIDLQYAQLNIEWTRIGCMNLNEAKILISVGDGWQEIWSGEGSELPTSDQLFNIDITSYIDSAEDLENLDVKMQGWAYAYGYTTYDLVELEFEHCECPTHNICNYQSLSCEEVYGSGENECDIGEFIPDCAECIDDSYCNDLDRDYCSGDLIKHDEGVCNSEFECEVQTNTIENCNDNDLDPIGTCFNDPDGIDYTWDFFEGFESTCDPTTIQCTEGEIELTHECDVSQCGAECDSNNSCENKCIDNTYYYNGDCLGDCTCDYSSENCDDGNPCTADSCDTELGCVHETIPNCCIEDSDCDYLDDNYCNCCTDNYRMQDEGVCEDNTCTVETTIIDNCDLYDTWTYSEWDEFTCYKTRNKEYRDYSCFEENDETYCEYNVTQSSTETQNINEGMVCDTGEATCKDACTIGQEQSTCQSGSCEFDIWTNIVNTNPFLCIDGQQSTQCSEQCGAECDEDSDCECEGEDGCVGFDYYNYPEYGTCENDCTCDIDDTPCNGPCKPTISYEDPRCYTCVDNDGDGHYAIDPNCPEGDDCDDNNQYVYPGATEYCCDGIDNDCDGLIDCQDPDCHGPCDDSDNDGVIDSVDECIGENQDNLPEDTTCSDWYFNSQNGCHEVITDDGSTVCETSSDSYYTCVDGNVNRVEESYTTYCGVHTGECDGSQTGGSSSLLFDECGSGEYCKEGSAYCQTFNNNGDFEPTDKETTTKKTGSRVLRDGPSKGQSDFKIVCGDHFCVMPQELEEGIYYCPTDCGLVW